ncbi:MAG: hypothetical protein ACI93P_000162 [bacterium]|jgi:hypothetical protein
MNFKNLNSFLKFGYFLGYDCQDYDFSGIDKSLFFEFSEQELIEYGVKTWTNVIQNNFEVNQKHVVPISGGLDSRAILAGLLEFTDASNIFTYTFGTPGTYDFEIGKKLSREIGTKHISYPLTNHIFSLEEELEYSKRSDCQTLMFYHPPIFEILKEFKGCNIWSGYGGDNAAGSHMSDKVFGSETQVKDEFIKKNTFVKSIDLTNMNDESMYSLISSNFIDSDSLTKIEQLDFNNRQRKYIEPHVLMSGFDYKTPFLDSSWFNFILSVDNKYRKDTALYKNVLLNAYPKLFSYPVSAYSGLPMNATRSEIFVRKLSNKFKMEISKIHPYFMNPKTNYLDFNEGLRTRKELKNTVYSCVMDLKLRNILDWIDIDDLWNKHQKKQANYADALITLASLEIHLKNGKKI